MGSNVLDTRDKSIAPGFGNKEKGITKREKFHWNQDSEPGTFMLIPKAQLQIDIEYQRPKVSERRVLEIARGWDWRLIGAISVVMRPDGTLWVYDGGHRARASFRRDDVKELPCMVFESESVQDEAKAFVGTNTMKTEVSAYHRHRASVVAGEPVAIATQQILQRTDYIIDTSKKAYAFCAIRALTRIVADDEVLAERVFLACADIAVDGENISRNVLGGLYWLAKHMRQKTDVLSGEHGKRLREAGIPGLEAAIRRKKIEIGAGGEKICALGILDLLNKRRRIKLTI